ncbi:hypothetical protein D3C75_1068130 [compost metagenome]
MFAAGQLIDHTRHRIEIAADRHHTLLQQFRGSITWCPGVEATAAELRQAGEDTLLGLAEPEVEQSHTVFTQHHVTRLQVAMQHTLSVAVCQGIKQWPHHIAQLIPR